MKSFYSQILSRANWQCDDTSLSVLQKDWLMHQGSLTVKLQQHYKEVSVQVISQQWFAKNEKNLTAYWQRDVLLLGDDKEIIFAQTQIPQITVENVAQDLLTLGNESIGLWLFPQKPQRLNLEWTQDPQTGLYARHSTLVLDNYPLKIKELFLENFSFPENPK
ncbi:chorismate--pyruvate lyase family protein [Phocoenobacter skyensis]|uniref:Chorismate lyase n=1 Tax=Phocoenobacter skyensis TaxID=97481 RepID=A0A1H7ULC6_9PAST|nr:chorismate lyase [Pasteurella skyensis]MDP8079464.1 chorismate lyase [Pasteurella skyensis]MDP8085319.1 chorismate lyase [Pasteurella skyensis]MDP8184528.1 chorismate lyase [Pasteurella skyensis]SEL97127.1 chorismate--pyruvate lyase [Pasteurella skyensis]